MPYTLGSLFDGSGGFPLAGIINGMNPLWASEIEPYPIRVTQARLPNMTHLGDVCGVNGAEVPPVDVITFGSPCQDLSIAGSMKGIHDGKRSSLFFEAIRIVKEMRAHDRAVGRTDLNVRPRFLVWENVVGAFSSNKGEDFRAVLEAIGSICQDDVSIPRPARGKWKRAGCVAGHGWSVAWRVYDAQHWGVPQRRKRIYLVADLGGERAGEVLFESESLPGDTSSGGEPGKRLAGFVPGSAGNQSRPSERVSWQVYDARGNGDGKTACTITGDHQNRVSDYTALAVGNGQLHQISMTETARTLDCMHDQQAILITKEPPVIRRLTPLECCRLQGFPDNWEDGVQGSDTARYRMWGNGIALPCAADVLARVTKALCI